MSSYYYNNSLSHPVPTFVYAPQSHVTVNIHQCQPANHSTPPLSHYVPQQYASPQRERREETKIPPNRVSISKGDSLNEAAFSEAVAQKNLDPANPLSKKQQLEKLIASGASKKINDKIKAIGALGLSIPASYKRQLCLAKGLCSLRGDCDYAHNVDFWIAINLLQNPDFKKRLCKIPDRCPFGPTACKFVHVGDPHHRKSSKACKLGDGEWVIHNPEKTAAEDFRRAEAAKQAKEAFGTDKLDIDVDSILAAADRFFSAAPQ